MSMDKVNGSPFVRQNQLDTFQGPERYKNGKGVREGAQDSVPPAAAQNMNDKAEISGKAREMADLRRAVEVGREALAALPDQRDDRVAAARQRLETGFYQSTQVRDRLAEGVGRVLRGLDEL